MHVWIAFAANLSTAIYGIVFDDSVWIIALSAFIAGALLMVGILDPLLRQAAGRRA